MLSRACRTARLDTLVSTRSTRRTCRVETWRAQWNLVLCHQDIAVPGTVCNRQPIDYYFLKALPPSKWPILCRDMSKSELNNTHSLTPIKARVIFSNTVLCASHYKVTQYDPPTNIKTHIHIISTTTLHDWTH